MLRLHYLSCPKVVIRFFFNDTPTTEIYTLSLHDALPISSGSPCDIPHGTLIAGWPVTSKGHRSEEHTSELQSLTNLVCRLLLEKKKINQNLRLPFNATADDTSLSYRGHDDYKALKSLRCR